MGIGLKPAAADGFRIRMQQPRAQQFADHIAQTARRVEMVHIGQTIGIDPRQKRRHLGEIIEILPVEDDPTGAGHGHQMDQ